MSRTISFFVVVLLALIVVRSEYVETHAVVNTTVTFDKEISRILRKRCLACHSDRNIGIPMTSYEETRPWAGSIQLEVLAKHMPPWRAVAGYGDFVNDSALTTKELQFITAWIEGNGPKTKLERVVINVEQNETPESERLKIDFATWVHGKPDLAAVLPTAMVEPGSGDTTRPVEIALDTRGERWVRAFEFKPADRRVVRAATFYIKETGQWLGSWTPWFGMMEWPEGAAVRIPAGAHIVADVAYRSTEEPVAAAGRLGLYYTKAPVMPVTDVVLEAVSKPTPHMTTGMSSTVARLGASTSLPPGTKIQAFWPELTPDVSSVTVSLKTPDGRLQVLLLVRDVIPEWPTPYILRQPLTVKDGGELSVAYGLNAAPSADVSRLKFTVSTLPPAAPARR